MNAANPRLTPAPWRISATAKSISIGPLPGPCWSGPFQAFYIYPSGWRHDDKLVHVKVGSGDVQKHFGNGADMRSRTPSVLSSRDGFGEAQKLVFLSHDFRQYLRATPLSPGRDPSRCI